MNRRVLCVDDEENVLRAFERNLRLHCEIETAVGAARGLEAVQERGPYAVVVSDLRMPEMDGIEATRNIRSGKQEQPVIIAMTANAMEEDRDMCLRSGMNDFLSKPIKPQDVVAMLEKWSPVKELKYA